jgi:hypothetical protein
MWTEKISGLLPEVAFREPAEAEALAACEEALGHELPGAIKELLLESDGVQGAWSLDVIWPVERIRADNLFFRSDADFAELYMPFEPLIFFGDDGGGDQFAFVRRGGRVDVFRWNHEDDSRKWVANNLEDYLKRVGAQTIED